jgi:hypothetical protein
MYESFTSPSHLDPVQYVSVMAENEELKSDLETSLQQLNDAFHERDQLKAENKTVRSEVCYIHLNVCSSTVITILYSWPNTRLF